MRDTAITAADIEQLFNYETSDEVVAEDVLQEMLDGMDNNDVLFMFLRTIEKRSADKGLKQGLQWLM